MNNPSFFLEGVVKEKDQLQNFEGPLSLILQLLSKNKIEIRDIKISDILDQYLEYLDKMESLDLEIASEFVQMAAHLLYIKTRTLLSGDEEVSELEVLMASLEQLQARDTFASIQQITPQLKAASEQGLLYYSKMPESISVSPKEYEYKHEPVDLLKAMLSIYSRGGKTNDEIPGEALPKRIVFSVRDKSAQIIRRLKINDIGLLELYKECGSKSEVVATFISILELCSLGSIMVHRSDGDYIISFAGGGDVDEIVEKIVE